MKLKTKEGFVVEVEDFSCYSPNENGDIMFAMGGFSYGWGKPTTEQVTHNISNDGNESLATRGRFIETPTPKL